jgi:hypothetical protein
MFKSFELFAAEEAERWKRVHGEHDPAKGCTCCGRKAALVAGGPYCEACARYSYGYDQAEATTSGALLGGAVKAALSASVSPKLIRRVVDEAIDAYNDEATDELLGLAAKAAS